MYLLHSFKTRFRLRTGRAPSNQPLRAAHGHGDGKLLDHAAREHSTSAKNYKRQGESDADGTAPHAVEPLHEVDELVLLQRDVVVLQLVLWKLLVPDQMLQEHIEGRVLLVLVELRVPLLLAGWKLAPQQLPINHAQPTLRQASDASECDHAVHHAPDAEQPVADGAGDVLVFRGAAFIVIIVIAG